MKRVVESVALFAALPIAGLVACGADTGSGSDQNPAPAPTTYYPPIQLPGQQPGGPPVVGNPGGPPIIGTPTSSPTTPSPTPTTPPTGTTTPVPTSTAPVPTGTVNPPVPTTPVPTGTVTPPPVPTTPPPAPANPPPAYDPSGKLLPPDVNLGMQISTPQFSLPPGSEQFKCYTTTIPSSSETDVHRWVSQMTPGSHHFILYAGGSAADGMVDRGCAGGVGGGQWVYASSQPDNQMPMPDDVAMPMAPNQKINFDMHYINTGSTPLNVQILLNIEKIQTANFQRAGALVSFNTSINVPALGQQTVSGSCATTPGQNFFILSTHTHKHATIASITDQGTGQELVHTTDWENPDTKLWLQSPFYNFKGRLGYSCSYQNDTTTNITVGTSAIKNEMCMAVTYFFPAPNGSQQCSAF